MWENKSSWLLLFFFFRLCSIFFANGFSLYPTPISFFLNSISINITYISTVGYVMREPCALSQLYNKRMESVLWFSLCDNKLITLAKLYYYIWSYFYIESRRRMSRLCWEFLFLAAFHSFDYSVWLSFFSLDAFSNVFSSYITMATEF